MTSSLPLDEIMVTVQYVDNRIVVTTAIRMSMMIIIATRIYGTIIIVAAIVVAVGGWGNDVRGGTVWIATIMTIMCICIIRTIIIGVAAVMTMTTAMMMVQLPLHNDTGMT